MLVPPTGVFRIGSRRGNYRWNTKMTNPRLGFRAPRYFGGMGAPEWMETFFFRVWKVAASEAWRIDLIVSATNPPDIGHTFKSAFMAGKG